MEVVINDDLIKNGTVEILKIYRDYDGWWKSEDGYAIKYDHMKAIEGVTYDVHEVSYSFGNNYESIDTMYIANTYLLSVYEFIRQCTLYFGEFYRSEYGGVSERKGKYTDDSDPYNKIDRILPLERTNGFSFGIDFEKFCGKDANICSIEKVIDGDYLVVMNGSRPISLDPERFFEYGFEIVDREIVIPKINFDVSCISYEQFKAICNFLVSTGVNYEWQVPKFAQEGFWAAKAKYKKETESEENEQKI